MRPALLRSLLVLSLAPACAALAVEHPAPHKIKVVVTPADPSLTIYYVGLLTKGSRFGEGTIEERRKDFADSSAYMNQLALDKTDAKSPYRGVIQGKLEALGDAK